MIKGDFHTHTIASDGRTLVKNNVRTAKSKGLKTIAITDHGFSSVIFGLNSVKFFLQQSSIKRLRKKVDINILIGAEANINQQGKIDLPDYVIRKLDVLIVGFHRFVYPHKWIKNFKFFYVNGFLKLEEREKLIETNTLAYIKMMETYPVDTISHLNSRCLVDVAKICEVASKHNVYIELNEKHIGNLEEAGIILASSKANFILGSDAHSINKIGEFAKVLVFIEKYNIDRSRVFGLDNLPEFKDKSKFESD